MRSDLAEEDGWQRLHPLSPVIRSGRLVPVILVGLVVSSTQGNRSGNHDEVWYVAIVGVGTIIMGLIRWLMTRWRIEGDALRIETGLIRRDSRRLPLARIQAVDVVRPLLARLLGVSELRIRLASSGSTDGRLAYLSEAAARELRGFLMAPHQDPATPPREAPEHPMAFVPTGRLMGSILLSSVGVMLVAMVTTLVVLAVVAPQIAAAALGVLGLYLFGVAQALWRRLSSEFRFEALEAPEGVRIRRGLLQTVSETIPNGRIQAVRQMEPLLWRPLGWCRLEVDVAGAGRKKQRGQGSGIARKALLPVGSRQEARQLVERLLGRPMPPMTRPPRRAWRKAPLSYHFLSAGCDDSHAAGITGRVRKVTTWVPLEKAQSIRRVQGPVQSLLGLATVHVDAAGRNTRVEFRDRLLEEANRLVGELADRSRAARLVPVVTRRVLAPGEPETPQPGWYSDPSGRHQLRFWGEGEWTEHVRDGETGAVDPPER